MYDNTPPPATLTAFLVVAGILIVGLLAIYYFSHLEMRRLKREAESKWPSATRRRARSEDDRESFSN